MKYFLDCKFIEDGKTIDLISIGIVAEDGREYYAISNEFYPEKANEWVVENVLKNLPPIPQRMDLPITKQKRIEVCSGISEKPWAPDVEPENISLVSPWKSRASIRDEVAVFLGAKRISSSDAWLFPSMPTLDALTKEECDQLGYKRSDVTAKDCAGKDIVACHYYTAPPEKASPEIWGEWPSYDWVAFSQLFGAMMGLPKGFPMRCRDVVQLLEDGLGLSQDDWPKSLETDGNHNALLGAKTVKARYEWCMKRKMGREGL